jgi:hypothetical protein
MKIAQNTIQKKASPAVRPSKALSRESGAASPFMGYFYFYDLRKRDE